MNDSQSLQKASEHFYKKVCSKNPKATDIKEKLLKPSKKCKVTNQGLLAV